MPFVPDEPSRFTPDKEPEAPKEMSFFERLNQSKPRKGGFSGDTGSLLSSGEAFGKGLEKFDQATYEAGGRVTDITGSPAAGTAVQTSLQAIPMMIGPGAAETGKVALSAISKMNPVKLATWREAAAEGYRVPQSALGGGSFIGNKLESIGGKAATAQQAAAENQIITDKLARRAASLPEGADITEATLSAAREKLAEPYRQISDLSPSASRALEGMKQARSEAKVYWRHYEMQADPKSLKMAEKLDTKAEAFEAKISKIAGELAPDLMPALKEARVALAKNYDVEKALNVGTGSVDAQVIGRMLDKRGLEAMTGELRTIGKFAQAFKPYSRSGTPAADVSHADALAAAILGVGGATATQYGSGNSYGAAAAALPLLRGPARSMALSKLAQEGIPISGQLTRPIQGSMVPLSRIGQPEPGRY